MDRSQAARILRGAQPTEQRRCEVCGRAFEGSPRAKYCGATCKMKAYRRRKAETHFDKILTELPYLTANEKSDLVKRLITERG
jgi:predicted nucleic acid-binding Zn ribbon protein